MPSPPISLGQSLSSAPSASLKTQRPISKNKKRPVPVAALPPFKVSVLEMGPPSPSSAQEVPGWGLENGHGAPTAQCQGQERTTRRSTRRHWPWKPCARPHTKDGGSAAALVSTGTNTLTPTELHTSTPPPPKGSKGDLRCSASFHGFAPVQMLKELCSTGQRRPRFEV